MSEVTIHTDPMVRNIREARILLEKITETHRIRDGEHIYASMLLNLIEHGSVGSAIEALRTYFRDTRIKKDSAADQALYKALLYLEGKQMGEFTDVPVIMNVDSLIIWTFRDGLHWHAFCFDETGEIDETGEPIFAFSGLEHHTIREQAIRLVRQGKKCRRNYPAKQRACRVCGCTDDHACPGGCAWVPGEWDLCTACMTRPEARK